MACPSTRSFQLVDQDPSDNVTSTYLLTGNGQTAQFNTANKAALAGAQAINNGSDNMLLDAFLDPTLGCTPFEAPDLSTRRAGHLAGPGRTVRGQGSRRRRSPWSRRTTRWSWSTTPSARPRPTSTAATSASRRSATPTTQADSPANFCQNMVNIQTPFLANNQALLATDTSPVPGTGNNLLTFMANRLNMSFTNLNCQNFGLKNPVTVTLDGNGAAIAATFNTTPQTATNAGATAMPSTPAAAGHRTGHSGGRPPDRPSSPPAHEPLWDVSYPRSGRS